MLRAAVRKNQSEMTLPGDSCSSFAQSDTLTNMGKVKQTENLKDLLA